ncbi:hypothetical protein K439DRAFT_1627757 [Ramaria rubella]|nr:hypothetical protein K439DRAFT_1627757 [Ramaria rubella]
MVFIADEFNSCKGLFQGQTLDFMQSVDPSLENYEAEGVSATNQNSNSLTLLVGMAYPIGRVCGVEER